MLATGPDRRTACGSQPSAASRFSTPPPSTTPARDGPPFSSPSIRYVGLCVCVYFRMLAAAESIHFSFPQHTTSPHKQRHPHPHTQAHVIERLDPKDQGKPQFLWRVEVLDRKSGTHLGHVFNGGLVGCCLVDWALFDIGEGKRRVCALLYVWDLYAMRVPPYENQNNKARRLH